jgi:hypothetical protein
MSAPDFTMLVIAALASVAAGWAYAMLARNEPGLLAAKGLAWSSALGFGSLGVIWGSTNSTYPLGLRVVAAATLAAVVAAALVWVINDINGQTKKPSDIVGNDPVKIIFKNEPPFVTVNPAGVNRRRMVRVRIDNNTDKTITNGRLDVSDLDPPYRDNANWLLKDAISIAPHDHTFVEVVYYDEGSSQAKPGTTIGLAVPMGGGFFAEAYPNLPITPHTLFLTFSTLEGGFSDKIYCKVFVDSNHVLHFENSGNTSGQNQTTLIPLHDAAIRFYEAAEESGFLELEVSLKEPPEKRLDHIKHLLMVDDRMNLFGIRPPSRKLRLINKSELTDDLFPGEGSTIKHFISDEIIWIAVSIPDSDLAQVIDNYVDHYKKLG